MTSLDPVDASLLNKIYATVSAPETWSDALVSVADYIGATGGMLVYHKMTDPEGFQVVGRLRDDLSKLYLEQYSCNPYSIALRDCASEQPILANDLIDPAVVRRTAFHADILAAQAIDEMVSIVHPSLTRFGSSGGMAFTLNRAQAADRDGVADRVRRLVPHLSRAVDLYLAAAPSRDQSPQVGTILNALPTAALLIDRRCRIVRTNLLADALLAQADGLRVATGDGSRLKVEMRSEAQALSRILGRAVAVAAGETLSFRASLRVTRPSGCPAYIVVATPLPPPAFTIWDAVDTGARALVQIIDPLASVEAKADFLKDAAGLTATEARVAGLVGGGRTTPEVARTLGLSPATVRTHLTRCFDKTGVRSQVALARLLASVAGREPPA